MLLNFIKGTLRNIAAHKSFTAINIMGLAVGVTCSLVISLFIIHETGYDSFHSNYNDIYRITVHGNINTFSFNIALTSGNLGNEIKKDISEVKDITTITKFGAWLVTQDSVVNNEDNIIFADTNFFSFFDGFKIIRGDKDSVLKKERSIVLTESKALEYFGSTNILGKQLLLETEDKYYTVTGVIKDPPSNSHMKFDMVASLVTYRNNILQWSSNNVYNYIKLENAGLSNTVEKQINQYVDKFVLPEFNVQLNNRFKKDDEYLFKLQPLKDIHLHSQLQGELEQNGNSVYIYAFGIVAILILLIACLNFMNLASANSFNRSREVALRKVVGADRKLLILQFLVESLLYSFMALVIGLLLTELILPVFNNYLNIDLQINLFSNATAVFWILVFALIIGMISGSYPAYFISSFEPVQVMHGRLWQGFKNSSIRAVFVVLQFSISILIILLTIVVYSQLSFMKKKDLGVDKKHVLVIKRSDALKSNIDKFKYEILENPDVLSASNSNTIPGRHFNTTAFEFESPDRKNTLLLNQIFASYDFCDAYNLEIVQGRFFNRKIPTDSFSCVVNESAAKLMGASFPVGATLEQPSIHNKDINTYSVIGVVKDFHFQSVASPIKPLIICFMPGNWEGYISVKLGDQNIKKTVSFIEETWKKYTPRYPFEYFFLDKDFNNNYNSQVNLGRIFIIFSSLSILIACLGLYGLISFVSNHRVREIGLRKALGATTLRLLYMLTNEVSRLMLISSLISSLLGYFVATFWLEGFHYRIRLSIWFFIISSITVFIFAVSTVALQSYKTVRKEPGDSLKYD